MSEVYIGDTGTIFHFTIMEGALPVNISGATVKKIKFQRKDKTTFERTAAYETDGTDGKLTYTTTASDINQAGRWTAQAYIDIASWEGHSSKINFTVLTPIAVVAP